MRSIRMTALAVAITLAFSGLALARDHDDFKHDHYKDKHEDKHHDWSHIWHNDRNHDKHNDRWHESERDRIREHERWEREHRNEGYYGGSVYNRYPNGGYGYPSGGYGYPSGGYGYPTGGYGRGGYGNGSARGAGYNQGLQDGSYQARKDIAENKRFNPNPRGSSHSDHGYHSYMGDKHEYQASYDQGYHSGYEANYGGRGRDRRWGF
jgi:Ni/Co efflux regulator RcnB